ncbi:Glucanosyltransferase-domain-containing protein [Crassisporium funariophilum]|nr:Glucanosyltransferase-domain-containing protein [Crassisporium funariophilum]
MRGEICISFASVLSFASIMLLIFLHVGQINTSKVPRGISMVKVNMTGYGAALEAAILNPVQGLYTNNASAPLQAAAGVRATYEFGLYSYCAYVQDGGGQCGNQTIGAQFRPYDTITADMASNYSVLSASFIQDSTFRDSKYLGQHSKAAYWMLLLGTICAALALLTGFLKSNFTFFLSSIFAVFGSVLLLIGASLWTVMIKKSQVVLLNAVTQQPLGIEISGGSGLFIMWAAFVCLIVSVGPYLLRAPVLFTLLTAFIAGTVQAIPKVTRTGRYLYTDAGSRFYIKGIAYQEQGVVVASDDNAFGEPSTFIDPLALGDACKRDLPFLQQLGVNAIRVYSVNSTLNHDVCMNLFSQAGIYTIIDLALPLNGSIDRLSPSWSTNILNQYINTIDVFSKYDNVLAYNIGNEVVLSDSTAVAPFVKAAARDTKAYLKSKGSSVLVGYAAINGASTFREPLANYLTCDPSGSNSEASSIDLYGLNDYSWCGDSNFQASYADTTNAFSSYNVVAYFSEFGCILSPPRLWTESVAIFSSDMSPVWSGGIAFSYFPATSAQGQFGLVNISQDASTVTTGDDFNRLKTQYGLVTSFIDSPAQSAAPASSYPSCAAATTDFVASTTLPPTPNDAACTCLKSTLSCQFTPATNNYTLILGQLLDVGCSLLGQAGGSCADIGGNGQTGVYGRISDCDPTIKLSFVMSQYYEANNRNVQACSFSGNGTVNPLAPPSVTAANAAASSCIANPGAVFTPSAPATNNNVPNTGTGKPASTGGTGGASTLADPNALLGLSVMAILSVMGAVWTLA